MADKIVLNKALGTYDVTQINNNFDKIANDLNEKVLYRQNPSGTTNTMKSDLDMNGFHVINLPAPTSDNEAARLKDIKNAVEGLAGQTANLIDFESGNNIKATNVQGAIEEVDGYLRDTAVNARRFGVVADGVTDNYSAIREAFLYCIQNGKDLFLPAGVINVNDHNFPFKNEVYPATSLLDCGNITIFGTGASTVLKTTSTSGADVLNLYSVKNLHFKDFTVTAALRSGASDSGSNGVSVVGGFDNITLDNIHFENLPYLDKSSYLDGGKALTVQPGTPATECGTLKATHIYAKGCVYGVGLEVDLVNWATKKHAIYVDIVAENCFQGVVFSAGEASGVMSTGMTMGFTVDAQLINCQRNVIVGRAHGVQISANIITTKSAAARRLTPVGNPWNSLDSVVDGLFCVYAKDSQFVINGDIGSCDYKAQIGGATEGSSGMSGHTENTAIFLNLGGSASTSVVNVIVPATRTWSIINSEVIFTSSTGVTLSGLPASLVGVDLNNTIVNGPTNRVADLITTGSVKFAIDGKTVFNELAVDTYGIYAKQTASSSTSQVVLGVKNHSGALLWGVQNGGVMRVATYGSASSVTGLTKVIPICDATGAQIGVIPLYATYS